MHYIIASINNMNEFWVEWSSPVSSTPQKSREDYSLLVFV